MSPEFNEMIRLTIPVIEEDDLAAVQDVLQSGFLVQGARVAVFEQAVADYVGTKYAVAVSNGTAALYLALLALDVHQGDMVITTAYSYVATANVIELCGAEPVFIDIEPDTFNLDPNRLEEVLNRLMANSHTARRVRAILPVHTFGQMAKMPTILEIAARYDLPVIEDAACALGATLHERQAGTWGIMGCFSFHPRKAITTGEGGIIVTDDPALTHQLRALRNHGQDPDKLEPDFILPGFNFRMTEFQAALGVTQIDKLNRTLTARRRIAVNYNEMLVGTPIQVPLVCENSQPVFQSYVVLLPESFAAQRQTLISQLKEKGIETTIGTWHIPMTTYFRSRYGYSKGDFSVADQIFSRSLTLPLHESLSEQEQEKVSHHLKKLVS